MFSAQEYIVGWLVYLIAVVGLLFIFWRMTRRIPWLYLKQCLRLIVATVLLLPAAVDDATHYWAPAWIKGFLQLVFGEMEQFLPIATNMLIAALGSIIVYVLLVIAMHFFYKEYYKKYPKKNPSQTPSQAH
ncbi:MAG: hypothetical protein ACRBCI_10315 [Cellvibrionaceae bacterium]